MSTPFTTPADASWQDLLDEITRAYSERRQAIAQSAYTPTDDKDVQAASYWMALQNWLESNCTAFVDHAHGPLTGAGAAFLYVTLATWRAAAGLNASGFRRVPEGVEWDGITDPVWSYGQMQAGDIIGPWIFYDLQKAFTALKWTIMGSTSFEGRSRSADLFSDYPDFQPYSDAVGLFESASWGGASAVENSVSYTTFYWYMADGSGKKVLRYGLNRTQYKHRFSAIPTNIPHIIERWVKGKTIAFGGSGYAGTTKVYIFGGQGGLTGQTLEKHGESSEGSDAVIEFDYLGSATAPDEAPEPEIADYCNGFGYQIEGIYGLVKWSFTNA